MIVFNRLLATVALFASLLPHLWAQGSSSDPETKPILEQAPPDKRVLGVLPNYRTANETAVYSPITVQQKFTIASKDSFDYPLIGLAAVIAGLGQWNNS